MMNDWNHVVIVGNSFGTMQGAVVEVVVLVVGVVVGVEEVVDVLARIVEVVAVFVVRALVDICFHHHRTPQGKHGGSIS